MTRMACGLWARAVALIGFGMAVVGCSVTPYPPYEGSRSAVLTVVNTAFIKTHVFALDMAACPEPKTTLLASLESSTDLRGRPTVSAPHETQPVRIPPGQKFFFTASTGGSHACHVGGFFVPQPNARYRMTMASTESQGRAFCRLSVHDHSGEIGIPEASFVAVGARYNAQLCPLR